MNDLAWDMSCQNCDDDLQQECLSSQDWSFRKFFFYPLKAF